jgi:hypothetical protein
MQFILLTWNLNFESVNMQILSKTETNEMIRQRKSRRRKGEGNRRLQGERMTLSLAKWFRRIKGIFTDR